jgi:transposase InsO family protein
MPSSVLRAGNRQVAQRRDERRLRLRALVHLRWARWRGWSQTRCADALGLDPATLAEWRRRWDDPADRLQPAPLGAPALTATPAQRHQVQDFLLLHGCHYGVRVLQEHFPAISRRDLHWLLIAARRAAHDCARAKRYWALTWTAPGRVWAMDFTEPPTPIDGCYRVILTVRDLASGCTLAAMPCITDDAAAVVAVLTVLFAEHGAPLVIKADNGPAFIAQATRNLLRHHRVHLLYSPAYTPSYNGACEAGNGVIKVLALELAVRHGRPANWTSNDVEAARLLANRRRADRTQVNTPEQRFAMRAAISTDERDQVDTAIAAQRRAILATLRVATKGGRRTIPADALERQAIAGALKQLGVYTIRSLPVRLCNPVSEAW